MPTIATEMVKSEEVLFIRFLVLSERDHAQGGKSKAGRGLFSRNREKQSEDRQWRGDTRPDKLDVRFSEKVTVAAKSRQCLESSDPERLDPLALQRARDKALRRHHLTPVGSQRASWWWGLVRHIC